MNVSTPENQPKTRILYVITLSDWGGAQKYVFELACAAQASGHPVQVVVGGKEELYERLIAANIPVVSFESMQRGIGLVSEFKSLFGLMRVIRDFRPDVVHSNSSKAGLLGGIAALLLSVRKSIFTCHGWAFNETSSVAKKSAYWLFHYFTVLVNKTTICVSEAIRRDTKHMSGIQSRLVVIHLGVEETNLVARDAARKKLGPEISDDSLWVGTVGRLDPVKQHDVLIQAFATIHSAFPTVRLLIVGEGAERARLEELVKTHNLQNTVHLSGHIADAQRYMHAFDIFAFPSLSESFGFAAIEAGLAHLPVVASNVGGIPEIITDMQTGLLVPSGNSDAIVTALSKLLNDAGLRAQLGNALHQKVLRDFTEAQMVEKTFALYAKPSAPHN